MMHLLFNGRDKGSGKQLKVLTHILYVTVAFQPMIPPQISAHSEMQLRNNLCFLPILLGSPSVVFF